MSAGGGSILSRAVHVIDLDDSRFHTGMRAVEQNARQGAQRIQGVLRGALAVGLGTSAFTSSIFAVRAAFEFAAEGVVVFNARLDQTTAAFTKLLGSRAAAEAQFTQLFAFAKETPFNFDAVLQGATALQVFGASTNAVSGAVAGVGESVLLTNENLRLFGDAAAATVDITGSLENGFKQSTFWIGRMYQALQNDAPIGRAAMSLERLGLLLPEIREQIELARSAGASGDEQFAIFKRSLERFRGLQEDQQQSLFTQASTVSDNVTRIMARMGRPIFDNFVDFLSKANDVLESGAAESFTRDVTNGVQRLAGSAKSFLTDPDIQKRSKAFLLDAVNSIKAMVVLTRTLVETAKPFVAVIALVANGANEIAKAFGTNALTLGVLVALALKFRRAISIGADVALGRQNATNLVRDTRTGNVLTSAERREHEQEVERKLRQDVDTARRREAAQLRLVQRTRTSLASAENQVDRNSTNRQDRALRAAETATQRRIEAQYKLNDLHQNEQAAFRQGAGIAQRRITLENDLALATSRHAKAVADLTTEQKLLQGVQSTIGRKTIRKPDTLETRQAFEAEAQKMVEAQEKAVRRARVLTRGAGVTKADREALAEEEKRLARIQSAQKSIGSTVVQLKQQEADLAKLVATYQKQVDASLKEVVRTQTQLNRLSSVETENTIKQLNATEQIGRQQQRLTRSLAGERLLQAKAASVAGGPTGAGLIGNMGGRTLQETTRLANQTSVLTDRERKLNDLRKERIDTETRLAGAVNKGITGFDRIMNGVSRVTQGLFLLAIAYEGVNIASGVFFNDTVPGLIDSLRKYGDTLGVARREALAFAEAQKNNASGAAEFDKEITAKRKQLDELRAQQARQQAENPIPTGGGDVPFNPLSPEGILHTLRLIPEVVGGRKIDETTVQIKVLEEELKKYLDSWNLVNDQANMYNGYLAGHYQLTSDVVREFRELMKLDPRFKQLVDDATAAREARQQQINDSLGIGASSESVLKKIKDDAEQFRDVGRASLLNFIKGFDSAEASDFGEVSDLAERIFKATGREGAVQDIAFGNLQVSISKAIEEYTKWQSVLQSTRQEIIDIAGDEGASIIALVEGLGKFRLATEAAKAATERFEASSKKLEETQKRVNAAIAQGEGELRRRTGEIDRAATKRSRAIDEERRKTEGLQEQAEDAAEASEKRIEGMRDEEAAIQSRADAAERRNEAAIAEAQRTVDALSDALEDQEEAAGNHADAFDAVIDGRIEGYLRERGQVDELSRAILARYEAEIGASRRLRDATRDRSDRLGAEQREQLLAFSEAIERARQRGDKGEVARLTRERTAFERRSSRGVGIAQERAGVAEDRFKADEARVRKAQEEQRLADAEITRNAKDRVTAAESELAAIEARSDAEAAEYARQIEAIQARITEEERSAKVTADGWKERITLQQNHVKDLENADADQKIRDADELARITAANVVRTGGLNVALGFTTKINDNNKSIADYATTAATEAGKMVDHIKTQNGLLLTQVGYWREIIAALGQAQIDIPEATTDTRDTGPGADGPGANPTGYNDDPSTGDRPQVPQNPAVSTQPTVPTSQKPSAILNHAGTPGIAPAGYHDEYAGGWWWWIPDNYIYDSSSPERVRPAPAAPSATPDPTPPVMPPQTFTPPETPPSGPTSGAPGLTEYSLRSRALTAGFRSNLAIPNIGASGALAVDPALAGGVTVNGPLIENATVREDADVVAIGDALAASLAASFDQNRRRGTLRGTDGRS